MQAKVHTFWVLLGLSSIHLSYLMLFRAAAAVGLPSAEDTPEEVLRTEIITEARSPIDGQPVTAAEYLQLQAQQPAAGIANRPEAEAKPALDRAVETQSSPPPESILNRLPVREVLRQIFPF